MTDKQIQQVLLTLIQTAKQQALLFRNLHEGYQALYDGLVRYRPELAEVFRKEMETIRNTPLEQSQLDALEDTLQLVGPVQQ